MKLCAAVLVTAISCAGAIVPNAAFAQAETREGIALQNQIAELRQELQTMQQSQQGGGMAPSNLGSPQGQYQPSPQGGPEPGGNDTAAQLLVRVSALEEQNRALQGRVDDLTNQIQRQHDELGKEIGDLSFKLGQGGTAAPPVEAGAPTQARTASTPPPAPVRRTAEMAMRDGNAALARRDYAAAAAAAREAMSGRNARGTDAQLLLARAEGGQRQYKEAAADFYQAYNRSPRSGNAPTALLGVANSLIAMNDTRDACQALAKLNAEFPASNRSALNSAKKRAACTR